MGDGRVFRGRPPGGAGCPQAGRAATRDASWFSSPGISRRLHVVADDSGSECCGMPLVLDQARALDDVDPVLRCQRHGCRERWP